MLRLSIQARQALAKLTLPVLIGLAFGLMLLGKADTLLAERARMALADALAPIYATLAPPVAALRDTIGGATGLWDIRAENARLRDENEQLRQWQSIALALDAENERLKANLRWIPDAAPTYVTARVVADAGGVYAKAVLLSVGPNHAIRLTGAARHGTIRKRFRSAFAANLASIKCSSIANHTSRTDHRQEHKAG